MTIIIICLCALGACEVYAYYVHRYAEDALLSVVSFALAMFFSALLFNGVGV